MKRIFRCIIAFILVLVIIYMGSDIDILNYSKENTLPLIITSFVVSLIKATIIFIGIVIIKKIINKLGNKK